MEGTVVQHEFPYRIESGPDWSRQREYILEESMLWARPQEQPRSFIWHFPDEGVVLIYLFGQTRPTQIEHSKAIT